MYFCQGFMAWPRFADREESTRVVVVRTDGALRSYSEQRDVRFSRLASGCTIPDSF